MKSFSAASSSVSLVLIVRMCIETADLCILLRLTPCQLIIARSSQLHQKVTLVQLGGKSVHGWAARMNARLLCLFVSSACCFYKPNRDLFLYIIMPFQRRPVRPPSVWREILNQALLLFFFFLPNFNNIFWRFKWRKLFRVQQPLWGWA